MSRSYFLVSVISLLVLTLFACGSATAPGEEAEAGGEPATEGAATDAAPGVAIFPDALVEKTIRLEIRKDTGPILISDVEPLTDLGLSWKLNISDLTGLEHMVNLTKLDLQNNKISDLSPLASLTNLTWLHLKYNKMIDVSPLASLTNLNWLNLQDNQISDLSPLASLTNLAWLNLQKNQISDLSPLASLTNLTELNLTNNNISDLSQLAPLTNLTVLTLSRNEISDLSPLLPLGLGDGATITLWGNPLSTESVDVIIPQLEVAGVNVRH